MTKKDFIIKSEQIYGKNRFDYSKVPESFRKKSKLTIICKIHNEEFIQTPISFFKKIVYCSGCLNDKFQTKLNDIFKNT